MGSDLYMLGKQIVEASHPRLVSLLRKIRTRLENDSLQDWSALIVEIDKELLNASIQ